MGEDAEARPFQAHAERREQPQVLEAAAREDDRSRTACLGARGREGGGDTLVEGRCDLLPRPAGGEIVVGGRDQVASADRPGIDGTGLRRSTNGSGEVLELDRRLALVADPLAHAEERRAGVEQATRAR